MTKRGFTVIEAVIIVVVVGVLSTLGLVAYNRFAKPTATTTASTSTTAPTSTTTVKSSADLDKVGSDLDSIDITDSSDTKDISSQASAF